MGGDSKPSNSIAAVSWTEKKNRHMANHSISYLPKDDQQLNQWKIHGQIQNLVTLANEAVEQPMIINQVK